MAPDCPREVAERSPTRSDGPMPLAHLAAHFEGCLPHSQLVKPFTDDDVERAKSKPSRSPDDCASLVYPRAPLMPFHIFSSMLTIIRSPPRLLVSDARERLARSPGEVRVWYDGPYSHRPSRQPEMR